MTAFSPIPPVLHSIMSSIMLSTAYLTIHMDPYVWKRIGVMVCKKSAYPNCSGALTNCSGRLITVPEDLWLLRKTYNCPEDLISASEHLPTAPEHLLTAPEHFRNCSGALS